MGAESREGENVSRLSLRHIVLKPEYNTEDNHIVRDLYAPCLRAASTYDRAVGFFRANIYRELGEDLLDFVAAGGRVRIVCSPDIPERDEDAAREGYDLRGSRSAGEREATLVEVVEAMSGYPLERDCLDMLRLLIERGSLDLFVAVRPGGIYHRKIGMFTDHDGNRVVFSGSGNETRPAVTAVEDWSNDEEFDVYRSWGDEFERAKASRKAEYLAGLFAGGTASTKVRPLTEVERSFLASFRSHRNLEDSRSGARKRGVGKEAAQQITPYSFQLRAIEAWEQAKRTGILSMATGTGKTYTALFAVKNIIQSGVPVLFLVPTQVLFNQWLGHLRRFFPRVPILLAGAGHDWRGDAQKRIYVARDKDPRIVLATMGSASSEDFLEFIGQAPEIYVVVDEVHRIGSPTYRRILEIDFVGKLGLSATPERIWDREGSEAIGIAFGESPVFDLPITAKVKLDDESPEEVPILGHFLSPYTYDFETVPLSRAEQDAWDSLTLKIKRTIARDPSQINEGFLADGSSKLKALLIERARILKKAEGKIRVAEKIVSKSYPSGGRWLIYCEDTAQLDAVTDVLRANHPHIATMKYDSRMVKDERKRILTLFEQNPGVIVCIRCLDEGVDVPAADGAVVLASSKNPREYIQRRGRVLRQAVGKDAAHIVDAVVLPSVDKDRSGDPLSIVRSELARAYVFAESALNQEVRHDLWRICLEYGVDVEADRNTSMQEDIEEE